MSKAGFRRPEDDDFKELVSSDINYFANCISLGTKPSNLKSVLVFPPVNNYRRFVIHQVCEEISLDLSHFSVGHGDGRRTVVCFKTDLVHPESVGFPGSAMGIDHNYIPGIPPLEPNHEKKAKTMPAVGIYRPPAARRLGSQEVVAVDSPAKKTKSKQRRPDIQVYVPRAKRASAGSSTDVLLTSPPVPATSVPVRRHSLNSAPQSQHKKSTKLSIDQSSNDQSSNDHTHQSRTDQQDCTIPATPDLTDKININCSRVSKEINPSSVVSDSSDIYLVSKQSFELDNKELVEGTGSKQHDKTKASMPNQQNMDLESDDLLKTTNSIPDNRSNTVSNTCDVHECDTSSGQQSVASNTVTSEEVSYLVQDLERVRSPNNSENQILNIETNISSVDGYETVCNQTSMSEETNDDSVSNNVSIRTGNDDPNYFISIGCDTQVETRVDDTCLVDIVPKDERIRKIDEEDSRCINREEQNRKNRSIRRGNINFISDLLVISDTESSLDSSLPHPVYKPEDGVANVEKMCEDPSTFSALRLNPDECTWDMMFDENGDCLDPLLMDELTSKVGSVTIKTPRSDYKNYATREFQPRDEYSHVVEIYNFPAAFKTKDLFTIFSPFSTGGFEIKWVDDTHCLGVFSSPVVAAEVLETNHPFCKTRPLCEATSESKAKARRSSEFLQPYRSRPETCPALARRLVTGALGVRLSTARQEREAEKALLKVARDKKKLEARQKEEAWEGTLVGTSSTAD